MELDLASLPSVQAFAAACMAAHPTIDVLLNNAGMAVVPHRKTAEGYEVRG